MNRALWIILVPTALVISGYVVVFKEMGIAPGYGRLAATLGALACAIWWVARRSKKKAQWSGK